jgi:uncharacterized protein YdhG (YjbR/CyaY superfamily)
VKTRLHFSSIDEYIVSVPQKVRPILKRLRRLVKQAVPKATECISYQMPAFKLRRVFIYFAAFKKHIGVFPPVRGDKALVKELLPYCGDKGNLRFPLDQPIPYELIKRAAEALALGDSE